MRYVQHFLINFYILLSGNISRYLEEGSIASKLLVWQTTRILKIQSESDPLRVVFARVGRTLLKLM